MTREEQKARDAKKYYPNDINCYYAFLHGAEWADKHPVNVWHDASEMPKNSKWILTQFGEDCYDTYMLPHFDADIFCAWCKDTNVTRWAYIDDLIPKGGNV